MERSETVFTSWFDNTSKIMNDWKKATDNWNGDQNRMWEDMSKMQQQWVDGYQSMIRNMASFTPGSSFNPFSQRTTQDAFFNMLKSGDIYTNLFRLWQPVFRQMQQPVYTKDFWKMVDPAEFRSFVDKLFGIDQGKIMQGFMEQYTQLMKMSADVFNNPLKNFSQSFSNTNPFFAAVPGMNNQNIATWYSDMMRSVQRSFTPFFGQTSDGTAPSADQLSGMMERWGKYISKVSEMQTLLYKTSISAWEAVVTSMNNRTAEGKEITSFDEFYNEWSAINEKEYVALFNTDEYAALQAELLQLQTEVARAYETQMEAFLQPYPVVLRSQMEEVYKTNHELRTRINDLERILSELQNTIRTTAENNNNKAVKKG
jgi:hypothetical protein